MRELFAAAPAPRITRRARERFLVNAALILVTLVALIPVGMTLLTSFKREEDVMRKPPVLFPCDTAAARFDPGACRWSVEGYERVLLVTPSAAAPLGFVLRGRMLRTFLPNTALYATATALGVMLLASLSGYAFSRYRFRGRDALLVVIADIPVIVVFLD